MRKNVKIMVGIRVAAALIALLLFSITITKSLQGIKDSEKVNHEVSTLLERARGAEVAHYKWSSNLSNALYANKEFTGSTDPTGCILGQWIYGEAGTDDKTILELRDQLKPLHEELHKSAIYVLDLKKTDPDKAQAYYQDTIQSNLTVLVGLLDEVIERGTALNEASTKSMQDTIKSMNMTCAIGLIVTFIFLISLVIYVLNRIIKPILMITRKTLPLQEGRLKLDLNYNANDEIGDLAKTLKHSLEQTSQYVDDINHIMEQLSMGNFDVSTSLPFIGDFRSIEQSINSFTSSLSLAMTNISQAEHKVSQYAEHLSGSAKSLADGATTQASAMEEIYTTLDDISKSAQQNIVTASGVQENAELTGKQVNLSSQQMEQLIAAMEEISTSSQEIQKIVSTIESIAFQTNILALNAAVEAARAGEAGKGFAVVSDEVRNLAVRSNDAAKATMDLIENSVHTTARGNEIVAEVSATLQKTFELIRHSNEAISEITDAVRTEATAISQATEGLGQISAVVQTNSASSEESAAVSTELFEQVRLLEEQTSRFKLKPSTGR